jgi:glycosyltransferase involved in cell wall biosynthesis
VTPRQVDARPRVLLVCDYFIRYQTGLAQGMRAQGWDPFLLGRDHQHAFGGQPGSMRAYIEERLGPEQPRLLLRGRVSEPTAWRAIPAVRRCSRRLSPTVTHIQACVCNDPRLVFAAGLRARRYALTVHDVVHHPGDGPPVRRHMALHARLLRHAGVVFVHAEALREQLIDSRLTPAPVVVVPHGVDRVDPAPLPAFPSLLFFGRISAYKGLTVLLDAMLELWPRHPALSLTIAGEGELPPHPAIADPRVRLLNRHILDAELPALFAQASAVVLPYIEASQSGVGSLAKGYGRPIVASAVGGLPELLSDGSGILVEAGKAERLASALEALISDPADQEQMRAAGLRTLQHDAGWPAVASRTIEAYRRYLLPSR